MIIIILLLLLIIIIIINILIIILIIILHMLHCVEHLYADSGFHLGCVFLILRFFCLQHLARDDYCIGGFSLAGLNRFCHPTTALLIIITILFFFILILSILIILIIPIILIIHIILIILFVLIIIVVIYSFLLPSLSSSSVSFIVLVSNVINIKRLALFVTCSNSKKPRETVARFRLHLANPPLRYFTITTRKFSHVICLYYVEYELKVARRRYCVSQVLEKCKSDVDFFNLRVVPRLQPWGSPGHPATGACLTATPLDILQVYAAVGISIV